VFEKWRNTLKFFVLIKADLHWNRTHWTLVVDSVSKTVLLAAIHSIPWLVQHDIPDCRYHSGLQSWVHKVYLAWLKPLYYGGSGTHWPFFVFGGLPTSHPTPRLVSSAVTLKRLCASGISMYSAWPGLVGDMVRLQSIMQPTTPVDISGEDWVGDLPSRPVFFNLFAAAEPCISATISHGTPCNDSWIQWRI